MGKDSGPSQLGLAARAEAQNRKAKVAEFMQKHDDGDDCLDKDELRKFLEEFHGTEKKTTDDELAFIMEWCDKNRDGKLTRAELPSALSTWEMHVKNKPKMETFMKKHDKERDGKLDRKELQALLTELNEGQEVTDKEVDFVLSKSDAVKDGTISIMELPMAVNIWYATPEDVLPSKKKSSMCVLL
jgi:Ca2+-binding EF-hand superfamily protein